MAGSVCLISMPFTPVATPGLGISLLKAALNHRGFESDVYYGALDFFRVVSYDEDPCVALDDYNFIASNQQLGDILFAPSLWNSHEYDLNDEVAIVLDRLCQHPNYLFNRDEMTTLSKRIHKYASRLPEFLDHSLRAKKWNSYKVLGFSSTFSQNLASLAFAQLLRGIFPELHIVFGGANCEGEMGEQILQSFHYIDAVIQGEADKTFPDYVQRMLLQQDTTEVAGVLVRAGSKIQGRRSATPLTDLDELPMPDFTDFFNQLPPALKHPRNRAQISLPIETSRGCWWGAVKHCTFCGLNPATMEFRSKSPERAIEEFLTLKEQYKLNRFTAVDNILATKYFSTVLPQLEGQGLEIFYETKANLKEHQVYQLAKSGVRSIQPGIESFSSDLLNLMRKGVHGYQNLELLKWCAIYGVEPVWFYLYRFPHEKHAYYFRDIERMERLIHLPPPRNPNPVLIDRYSPLFFNRNEFGISNLRPFGYASLCYTELSQEEQRRICYHFEADLPQGNYLPYEPKLWEAIAKWRQAYNTGARLYQFRAISTTLIVDTRKEKTRCFLLTGYSHHVYDLLRNAKTFSVILSDLASVKEEYLKTSFEDIELAYIGALLDAEPISFTNQASCSENILQRIIQKFDCEHLVDSIDGRWLALAIECTKSTEAERFGLAKFIEKQDSVPARRTVDDLSDLELIQIIERGAGDGSW